MHRPLFWLFFYLEIIQVGYAAPSEKVNPIGLYEAESLLDVYLQLYTQNQDVFTVYHGKKASIPQDKSLMLYRHICQDKEFKPICKTYKPFILDHIENRLRKIHNNDSSSNKEDLFKKLKPIVDSLREKFSKTTAEFHKELAENMFEKGELNPSLITNTDFNRLIQNIYQKQNITKYFTAYQTSYLEHASTYPGLILLSKKMKGLIEGHAFDIERDDFLLAVDELGKKIRSYFQQTVSENPSILKSLKNFPSLKEREWIQREWKKMGFDMSQIPQITETQFALIKKFHANDVKTIQFLIDGLYLKAFWRLRNLGFLKQADGLEEWISTSACADSEVKSIGPLGGGVTITKLVTYPFGIRGVYKPIVKPGAPYRGVLEWIGDKLARYKHEIAAYRIDRLLNLNYVPITKEVHLTDGVGSLQYFVEPATQARFMNQAKNPKASFRWAKHRGRALEDGNIRLFDWIISNIDRNIDNYLIQEDGQMVLIDHSFSFFYQSKHSPSSSSFLHQMVPSRRVFYALSLCDKNPKMVDQELRNWVSQQNLLLVKQRIHHAVVTIQKFIQKRGEDAVFSQMDELDERMGVSRLDLRDFNHLDFARSYGIESNIQMVTPSSL